jgi:hypothetical protein
MSVIAILQQRRLLSSAERRFSATPELAPSNMLENEGSTPRVLEKAVRYRTLAIWCFVLLGAMFAVPATIWAVFLPSLKQGLPDPIPIYERVLLEIAVFCGSWKWLLVLPLLGLGMAFTVLASSRVGE